MTSSSNFTPPGDDYKLQEEGAAAYGEETPMEQTPIPTKRSAMKRLLIPVFLVIAVFIVYYMLNYFSTKKDSTETQPAVPVKPIESTKPIITAVISPTPAPAAVATDQILQTENALRRQLETLAQQTENNREQISGLNDNVYKAQQEIATLNQNLEKITESIQSLTQNIHDLATPKKPKKRITKKPFSRPKIYHVKAIVPGRVWLEADDGQTVTLRVGDRLDGYGTVELISPRQGMVITSTGTVIQYGNNDA
ncbi:MAG: hypothetical protein M1561_02315 [Gammaproteobacteria bacterium]|nr:hypothetical protein [Gammaproteobacteria bacterium]